MRVAAHGLRIADRQSPIADRRLRIGDCHPPILRRQSAIGSRRYKTGYRPSAAGYSQRGFTLLEILVATVIVALVMSSLLVTFHIGTRAYEEGMSGIEEIQTLRTITDSITRDLRSIYFRTFGSYNITYEAMRRNRMILEQQREMQGLTPEQLSDPNWVDPLGYNALDFTYQIDLSFRGKGNGFEFVRFQPTQGDMATQPWGLARVKYEYDGKNLVRNEQPVYIPKSQGGEGAAPSTELSEVVGENIASLSIRYGYFYEGKWLEADSWESEAREHRNPQIEYDSEDPMADRIKTWNLTMPRDDLPAYIDIEVTVADSAHSNRTIPFSHFVSLPAAQESYWPLPPDIATAPGNLGRRLQ